PHLKNTPIRPSFMAHIGLELLLDHLLIQHKMVDVNVFYKLLELVDRETVQKFLTLCGYEDSEKFFKFYEEFLDAHYISTYKDLDQILKALIFICKRV